MLQNYIPVKDSDVERRSGNRNKQLHLQNPLSKPFTVALVTRKHFCKCYKTYLKQQVILLLTAISRPLRLYMGDGAQCLGSHSFLCVCVAQGHLGAAPS